MGFLSGVLGAVKNENEVTTYDNYITGENNKLKSVLETLTNKIGSGRTGLAASVGAVKGWLGKYNSTVTEKTKAVTNALNALSGKLINGSHVDAGEYYKYVIRNGGVELTEQLETWKNIIPKISETLNNIEHDNVNFLDNALKHKIKSELKPIQKSVQVLWNSAENVPYVEQVSHLERTLEEQKQYMQDAVKAEGRKMETKFADEFSAMGTKVMSLAKMRKTQFSRITAMLQEFHTILMTEFETECRERIKNGFDNIRGQMTAIEPTITFAEGKKSKLRDDFDKLKQQIMANSDVLNKENTKLEKWKTMATNTVKRALHQCSVMLTRVNNTNRKSTTTEIAKAAKKLQADAEQLWKDMKAAQTHIQDQVQAANTAVTTTLKTAVKQDLQKLRDDIKLAVVTYFGKLGVAQFSKIKHTTDWTGIDRVSIGLRNWIKGAKTAASTGRLHLAGYPNNTAFPFMLNFLDELTKKIEVIPDRSMEHKSFFDVMGEDTKAQIDTDFGQNNMALNGDENVRMTSYNGSSGKDSVTMPLSKINEAEGLPKLDGKDSEGQAVKADTFSNLYATIESQLKDLTNFIIGPGSLLDDTDKGIQTHLTELNHMLAKADAGKHYGLTSGLTAIFEQLSSAQKRISQVPVSGSNEIDAIIQKLESLPNLVDAKKAEALETLDELKRELNHRILITLQAVADTDQALSDAIQAIRSKINEAFDTTHDTLMKLKTTLLAAVNDALRNVTDEVRSLFAEGHKADLAALKTLVDGQKKEIEKIIEDKHNGLKGLLIDKVTDATGNKLDELIRIAKMQVTKKSEQSQLFTDMSETFRWYSDAVLDYIRYQLRTPPKIPGHEPQPSEESKKVGSIRLSLDALLEYLKNPDAKPDQRNPQSKRVYMFDHNFDDLLASLNSLVTSLSPSFTSPSPLLAPLKSGLSAFTEQLGHAYVNRYSGVKMGELTKVKPVDTGSTTATSATQTTDYVLTTEGRNCAKVCLTIVEILGHDLTMLREKCNTLNGPWRDIKIRETTRNDINELGHFLTNAGFTVPSDGKKQDGELRYSQDMKGENIFTKLITELPMIKLNKHIESCSSLTNITRQYNVRGILTCLAGHLKQYYQVCHLGTTFSKTQPSSVHQMLVWLTGLPNMPTYDDFTLNAFTDLFQKEDKEDDGSERDDFTVLEDDDDALDAYPSKIKAMDLTGTLSAVCTHAHSALTAILGHGHEDGVYAVDFNTNEYRLSYPSNNAACLDMLVDVLCRLYEQLYFLLIQCSRTYESNSWRDCWYGRYVGGSDWRCNTKQCANQNCKQIADQKVNQTCDQHPKCGLKSPLQSFLEDGLPGFLPHSFKKPGCKPECTLSNHRGIPCKTPMGFIGISNMASHTQKGTHLRDVLIDFCGNSTAPLTLLCAYFNCLLQRPPQNLGDMFAFYYNLLKEWSKNETHKRGEFDEAVKKANFENPETTLELADLFTIHNGNIGKHTDGHLSSLVSCDGDGGSNCGRYLKPISTDVYTIYSSQYADKYVSWIVYLTETFYDLLKKLYEECNGNCGPKGSNCHNKCCVNGCPSLEKDSKIVTHDKDCKSIVQCKYTLPTLCRYGFTFWYQTRLNGEGDINKKRTCKDFCNVLDKVLSDKESDQAPLAILIYKTIPNFLFKIRAPFIWLNVALWLLSFLYLIHIMIIRLDLLHIKSHLHSPSSHRIAAQSLLAAGRVNKLGRVFYLQP